MQLPHLYRELSDQFRQWIQPRDQRHLEGVSEAVAAILQSESACIHHWLPYLSHRGCTARSHHARLNYLLTNPQVNAETFYVPLLQQLLQAFVGEDVLLTLDTSVLWDQFCWVGVCFVWGGRSFTLAQMVLEHGSASVAFDAYLPVLEQVLTLLPPDCRVTLLADRGFEHGELIRWCNRHNWQWSIRAKSNLTITLASGRSQSVAQLLPPVEQVYLFPNVTILEDISCHLATATLPGLQESWAVLSSQPPSLQTFERYGKRFGGIEPHIKDYKSAAFEIIPSHLRDATALTSLFMLLDIATLIALILGCLLVRCGLRRTLDTHPDRGLSFLQLGLRYLEQLRHLRQRLPRLQPLPRRSPPAACASASKRERLNCRIQFSKVTTFSS
ncbi:transposase [Leptolyngbya sp. AN03gr2]|uniref:transposase n=1 Tax=unclassified Leptolyngbya TaxID=2650499 RepID=UPI003D310EF4